MAVLFGDLRKDGLVRVWRTLHTSEGKKVDAKDYPDGYEFDEMPEYPEPKKGISHVLLFNPDTQEFSFIEEERALNEEEAREELLEVSREILATLKRMEEKK